MDRLLFVDDDKELLTLNRNYFTKLEFAVDTASNMEDAMAYIKTTPYDCIILDIRMDGSDGFTLCARLRNHTQAPVIFLTVLTDEESLEKGFQSGGDDYMIKPYRIRELELRILARIRSGHSVSAASKEGSGCLTICQSERQAYIGNQSLNLTVSEFQILDFLSRHKGVPFRQYEIYEALWGESYNTHSVQVLIMRIRRKIHALSPNKEYIHTQWGKGYLFTE